jgi:hypothetical protein
MNRRSLLSVLALASSAGCVEHPLPTLRGVMTRKRVVGPAGALLVVTEDDISVESARLAGDLPRERERGNTSITGKQLEKLLQVEFRVTIRHGNRSYVDDIESGETGEYRTNRSVFNRLMAADRIEFQIGLVNQPSLLTPSRVVRTGRIERKWIVGTHGKEPKGGRKRPLQYELLNISEDEIEANRSVLDAERTVGAKVGAKLRKRFDTLGYHLAIEHDGRRRIYRTKRRQFNRAQVGGRRNFEVDGEYGGQLVRYVSRGSGG